MSEQTQEEHLQGHGERKRGNETEGETLKKQESADETRNLSS